MTVDELLERCDILPESPIGIVVAALMSYTEGLERRVATLEEQVLPREPEIP